MRRIVVLLGALLALPSSAWATWSVIAVDRSTGDLVALRSSWVVPPHPVRIARDGAVIPLATPAAAPAAQPVRLRPPAGQFDF